MPAWEARFLKVFRETGNVRKACEACRINRSTPYVRAESDPEFKARWAEAEEDACDELEYVARERAKDSSDFLLKFLLQSLRPSKYKETTRQEHTGADGQPIAIEDVTNVRTQILGSLAGLADANGEGSGTLPADTDAGRVPEARLALLAAGEADPSSW